MFFRSNFHRHPEVDDYRTNPNIGGGFGLARTIDPLRVVFIAFYVVLRFKKFLELRSLFGFRDLPIIDLGCGDGVILKVFYIFGFRKITGVEIDSKLCLLAKKNVPAALVLNMDFGGSSFRNWCECNRQKLLFAFNPAPQDVLTKAIFSLAQKNEVILILRNPVALFDILNSKMFSSQILVEFQNIAVIEIRHSS